MSGVNAGAQDALATIASTAIIKGQHKENTAKNRNKVYDDGSSGGHTVFAHMGGATALYSGDWNRKSDPYVNVYWGEELVGKTRVLYNDVNPVWNETIEFHIKKEQAQERNLRLEIFDKDQFSADDFMGMVTLPGQMVWDLVTVKKEMWSEENMMIPIEDKHGKVIDQSSTMGFSVFGNREAIHRYEGIWVLRKKQLETATASLVERKWYILSPQMPSMQRWDLVILVALCYTASVTPYEVMVLRQGEDRAAWLVGLNVFVDCIFGTDIILNFFLAYFDTNIHQWMYDQRMIMINYMSTYFFIDLISVLPINYFGKQFGSSRADGGQSVQSLRLLRVLRLSKLTKLLRIFKAKRIAKNMRGLHNYVNNAVMRLLRFLTILFTLLHWTACIWAFTPEMQLKHACAGELSKNARIATMDPDEDNDLVYDKHGCLGNMDDGGGYVMDDHTGALADGVYKGYAHTWLAIPDIIGYPNPSAPERYFQALEFAMCAMVMDFAKSYPTNLFEQCIAIFLCLMMGSVYGYMIGTVCSVVSSMDPATSEYNQTMDQLNQFLSEIRLEEDHANEVREYFRYSRGHFRNQYHKRLLMFMSPALRGMVTRHQHSVWIRQVWFFNCNEDEERNRFVTDIGLSLVLEAFSPNELIIRQGDVADKMYIVQRGLVGVNGRPMGIGRFFGEDMILEGSCFTFTARVLTYLDVYSLSRVDLVRVLEMGHFPNTKKLISLRVLFMKFQAKIRLLVKAVRAADTYVRHTPDDMRYWKEELRNRGKDAGRRRELSDAEEHMSAEQQNAKGMNFMKLYKVGLAHMSEVELQNARVNGCLDEEDEEPTIVGSADSSPTKLMQRKSSRASVLSPLTGSAKKLMARGSDDRINSRMDSLSKSVGTLREDMDGRMEKMEEALQKSSKLLELLVEFKGLQMPDTPGKANT